MVSYYDGKGTYKLDKENFSIPVRQSNAKLAEQFPNYRFASEKEILLNNGWKGYEMRFEGGKTKNGDEVNLWGSRIFIPAQRRQSKAVF